MGGWTYAIEVVTGALAIEHAVAVLDVAHAAGCTMSMTVCITQTKFRAPGAMQGRHLKNMPISAGEVGEYEVGAAIAPADGAFLAGIGPRRAFTAS